MTNSREAETTSDPPYAIEPHFSPDPNPADPKWQAFFRKFRETGYNIGSLTSAAARATVAPYTVAKGGIQANAIGLGYRLTDMNQALVDDLAFDAWVTGHTPAKRWGRPEESIGAAVVLASRASDDVNGQITSVDGGMPAVL